MYTTNSRGSPAIHSKNQKNIHYVVLHPKLRCIYFSLGDYIQTTVDE